MSIKIYVTDGITPLLDEMVALHYGVAMESLSVAGDIVRKNAHKSMRGKTHHWMNEYVDGKRRLVHDGSNLKELGVRISGSGVDNPSSMANMITSYLMPKSMTVVIGGMHKGGSMTKYRDGKPNGSVYLKGVGKHTHAILHKLNFGERNEYHNWDGKDSMDRFKNARYRGYHFMEDGYSMSVAQIHNAMTRRYEAVIGRAVNRANVRVRTSEVA